MEFLWLLGGIAGAGVLVLLIAYICFRLTFYVKRPEKEDWKIKILSALQMRGV